MGIKGKKSKSSFWDSGLSPEEKLQFEKWLKEEDHEALLRLWDESLSMKRDIVLLKLLKERKRRNLERFVRAIHRNQRRKVFSIAASFLLLLGGGLVFSLLRGGNEGNRVLIPEVNHSVILKTCSGIEYLVHERPVSRLEYQGIRVCMTNERISYSTEGPMRPSISDSLLYNELIVPRGKIYEVELEDGTRVRLNSESRLRYPILFKEDKPREVFLKGEGYFQVNADLNHPFIVHSPRVDILVYGTTFNVKAYPDDSYSNVTLIEGKLKITDVQEAEITLQPKEEINCSNKAFVSYPEKANVDDITSWREGKLYFDSRRLSDIAKDLERKYDITILFDSPETKQLIFFAKTQQFDRIEDILELLKLTGEIDYEIKGRNVYLNRGNEE